MELELEKKHAPETEEYGISSTIFRAKNMPFHPKRLGAVLNGFGNYESAVDASKYDSSSDRGVFKGVVRSKGHLWLANAHAFPMAIHTAGKHLTVVPIGAPFLAAMHQDDWDEEAQKHQQELVRTGKWDDKFGDRSTEIVFIGVHLCLSVVNCLEIKCLRNVDRIAISHPSLTATSPQVNFWFYRPKQDCDDRHERRS